MRTMSIRELRAALSSIDNILEDSGEVIVTRHGRPVARLCPTKSTRPVPSHARLRASTAFMTSPSEDLLRAERDRLCGQETRAGKEAPES